MSIRRISGDACLRLLRCSSRRTRCSYFGPKEKKKGKKNKRIDLDRERRVRSTRKEERQREKVIERKTGSATLLVFSRVKKNGRSRVVFRRPFSQIANDADCTSATMGDNTYSILFYFKIHWDHRYASPPLRSCVVTRNVP